jgi:hypothetical protein
MIGWMKLFFVEFQVFYDSYDKQGWLLLPCYEAIETMKQKKYKNFKLSQCTNKSFFRSNSNSFFLTWFSNKKKCQGIMELKARSKFQQFWYTSHILKSNFYYSRWLQGRVAHFLCHNPIFCRVACIYILLTWHKNNKISNLWLDLDSLKKKTSNKKNYNIYTPNI